MPRTWMWLLGGFAAGLLLFLLVLLAGRRDERVADSPDAAPPTADGTAYTPLPSPLPADADGASGMGDAPDAVAGDDSRPHLIEPPPPPPAPAEPEMPLPDPVAVEVPVSPSGEPTPIPGQTPPPRYPATSLRRGETGTVLVRATIGVDGRPRELDIARSSGYRRLDRAAMDAVRRWRFQPAQSNGQPVEASVNVPIEFTR